MNNVSIWASGISKHDLGTRCVHTACKLCTADVQIALIGIIALKAFLNGCYHPRVNKSERIACFSTPREVTLNGRATIKCRQTGNSVKVGSRPPPCSRVKPADIFQQREQRVGNVARDEHARLAIFSIPTFQHLHKSTIAGFMYSDKSPVTWYR